MRRVPSPESDSSSASGSRQNKSDSSSASGSRQNKSDSSSASGSRQDEPARGPSRTSGLPLTGERTVPGVPDERYWFERHVVAYRLAAAEARGRVVLDAGCGEGYGAAALHDAGARRVVAADLDADAVAHVRRTYPAVEVVQAELGALPLADAAVDLVVSLQVVEHVWDVPGYLRSLRRVLAPGGRLVLSTPNRLTFTPGSDRPQNPFHVREFAPGELATELDAAGFAVDEVLGIRHGAVLSLVDRALGQPLPQVLSAAPPEEWPPVLRWLVRRVGSGWFRVRPGRLDSCLDLVAIARPRPGAGRFRV